MVIIVLRVRYAIKTPSDLLHPDELACFCLVAHCNARAAFSSSTTAVRFPHLSSTCLWACGKAVRSVQPGRPFSLSARRVSNGRCTPKRKGPSKANVRHGVETGSFERSWCSANTGKMYGVLFLVRKKKEAPPLLVYAEIKLAKLPPTFDPLYAAKAR